MSILVEYTKIKAHVEEIFIKAGLSEEHAKRVADNLSEAEARGVKSHGLVQVLNYVNLIEKGRIVKDAEPVVIKETPTTLLVDGAYAPGSVSGTFTMERVIKKAKESGVAVGAVKNGTHFGIAAYYAMKALKENLIGFAFCNAGTIVAPFAGYSKELGTNPICVTVPAKDRLPLVFDAATSEAAFNKIFFAKTEGKEIPLGWALDKEGNPTTVAQEAMEGALIPFGGYKGYGLSVIVNVLTGILSGSTIIQEGGEVKEDSQKVGFHFAALDISKFQDIDTFKISVDLFINRLKQAKRTQEDTPIYVPGEVEFQKKEKSLKEGIIILDGVQSNLIEAAEKVGVKSSLNECAFNVH